MEDVEVAEISETEDVISEWQIRLKQPVRKNSRDLYRKINLRRVTSLELIWRRLKRVKCLQTPTVFWLGGGMISLSYCKDMGLMMSD
jgi:hypothetical protein